MGREERKVDLVVSEMKRYGLKVAGLQETRWFDCDACEVAGCVVLTSGRPFARPKMIVFRGVKEWL